jgi:hypothetical protein
MRRTASQTNDERRECGPEGLENCESDQARAEQKKAANGHSEETVRSEFFAHGTPPFASRLKQSSEIQSGNEAEFREAALWQLASVVRRACPLWRALRNYAAQRSSPKCAKMRLAAWEPSWSDGGVVERNAIWEQTEPTLIRQVGEGSNPLGYPDMRLVLAALCIAASASAARAQTELNLDRLSASQPIKGGAASPDDNKGQSQSPGPAGPLTTGSGGASAANPQGGTPPNMQVAPDGSSKTRADQK